MKERAKLKVPSRYGVFSLEATERGLYRLSFPSQGKRPAFRAGSIQTAVLKKAKSVLTRYLKGGSVSFKRLPLDLSGFTAFERKVLRVLSSVPRGMRWSYADLAREAGAAGAARAVGQVMKKNRLPIILPCHRIVGSNGALGGYGYGPKWKRRLLHLEGVE